MFGWRPRLAGARKSVAIRGLPFHPSDVNPMRHRDLPFAGSTAPVNRQAEELETSVNVCEDRQAHWHAAP